jgi:imidazoleglycerol-phosphate dehydratase
LRVRAEIPGSGGVSVETGVPVLDHVLELLAQYAGIHLLLEVEPGTAVEEAAAAGAALGQLLRPRLREAGATGHGSASCPAAEALAHVALEISDVPLVVSNVDLSEAHVGGLAGDVVGGFLQQLAEAAGVTIHVRLLEGDDPQHVLEAMFKTIGIAFAQAGRLRTT